MPRGNSKKSKTAARVERLRRRLAEAMETLEAIRSGAADALVVQSDQGEQVFTLKGADQVYRVLVDAMNEGAVSLNPSGCIVYCNSRFSEMVGTSLDKVLGIPFCR